MPIMPCPQCRVQLSVPDDLVGKRVSCRSCGHQFTAQPPAEQPAPPPPPPVAPPPSAVDCPHPGPGAPRAPAGPYYAPYPGYPGYGVPGYGPAPLQTSGHAIASMVLGIIAIPTCMGYGIPSLVCGILAVVFANTAYRELAAGRVSPNSMGLAKTGKICGWIGIGLSIAFWGLIVLFVIIGISTPMMMR